MAKNLKAKKAGSVLKGKKFKMGKLNVSIDPDPKKRRRYKKINSEKITGAIGTLQDAGAKVTIAAVAKLAKYNYQSVRAFVERHKINLGKPAQATGIMQVGFAELGKDGSYTTRWKRAPGNEAPTGSPMPAEAKALVDGLLWDAMANQLGNVSFIDRTLTYNNFNPSFSVTVAW